MKLKIEKWTTHTEWVDLETGEALTENETKQNYRIIKKQKNVKIHKVVIWETKNGKNKGTWKYFGNIYYTNECRKNEGKQGELW